jgi:hypothetical protein
MRLLFSVIAGALLFGLSGLYHGLRTDRWGASENLSSAVERLQRIPFAVGKWHGEPLQIDAAMLRRAETAGWIARKYVHPEKGEVQLLVLCGRPGPISLHTPEVCYPGIGYALFDKPERVGIGPDGSSRSPEFWIARFTRSGTLADALRIAWSWNSDGSFVAADHPRVRFAADKYLYKIYVVSRLRHFKEEWEQDGCRAFLQDLMPELEKALLPLDDRAASDPD